MTGKKAFNVLAGGNVWPLRRVRECNYDKVAEWLLSVISFCPGLTTDWPLTSTQRSVITPEEPTP